MLETLQKIHLTPRRYLIRIVLPSVGLSTLAGIVIFIILTKFGKAGMIRFVPLFLPVLGILYSLIYPHIQLDNRKRDIESRSHFFITAFGVLSISDVDRKWLLKLLSEKEELKYLAKEIYKIYILVAEWNQSLAQAVRFLSRRTPSRSFADFLDRFGYSIDSGEQMDKFLFKEQKIVMNDYSNHYKGALYDIDMFKEIYAAIILSLAFLMSFMIIIPMLIGADLLTLAMYASFFFIMVELAIVYFIKTLSPYDPIWISRDISTEANKKITRALVVSAVLCLLMGVLIYFALTTDIIKRFINIPFQIYVAVFFTPLFIAGYIAKKEEDEVKRKDENFPGFIRSLGGSASAKGGLIMESLYYLTAHDFGPLSGNIVSLYRRLHLGIDTLKSWQFFSAETGSNLIDVFSKIFVESVHLGGDPGKVGGIVSSNFGKILALRKQKFQVSGSLTGISYGLTAGVSFSIAISYSVAKAISTLYSSLGEQGDIKGLVLEAVSTQSLEYVSYIVFFILIVHSFFSSILIKIVDGGRHVNALMNFTVMVWVSAIVFSGANKMVSTLLSTQFVEASL